MLRSIEPREITHGNHHEDVFNFPLVTIVKVEEGVPFPVLDKFSGPKLDLAVKQEGRRSWSKRDVQVSRRYWTPDSEKQAFAHQLALVKAMKQFTLPSPREIEQLNETKRKRQKPYILCDLPGMSAEMKRYKKTSGWEPVGRIYIREPPCPTTRHMPTLNNLVPVLMFLSCQEISPF
ncbi:hypothetical protein SELMODRAFT_404740 [Selaginella moellendorffii]|uniref:Uncharacterized protein n=1 Tax=Selaginella moellendorffii TaxID=88036 RepID=D8QW88_SELML|nr:hypothetical protein SELMODRAFT_404740 [Selaginella moellendorffii]